MSDHPDLPPDWQLALSAEFEKDYFKNLMDFVAKERAAGEVYPPEAEVFSAFKHSPFLDHQHPHRMQFVSHLERPSLRLRSPSADPSSRQGTRAA